MWWKVGIIQIELYLKEESETMLQWCLLKACDDAHKINGCPWMLNHLKAKKEHVRYGKVEMYPEPNYTCRPTSKFQTAKKRSHLRIMSCRTLPPCRLQFAILWWCKNYLQKPFFVRYILSSGWKQSVENVVHNQSVIPLHTHTHIYTAKQFRCPYWW